MKDNLQHLFRDRFQGHEAPVDPGAWQAIQGQLAAAAPAADGLNDLFRERFAEHEMEVDPSVWQGVSTQLGHTAAAGAGASATVWGWVAAATGAVVITAAALLWTNEQPGTETAALPQRQVTEAAVPVEEVRKGDQEVVAGTVASATQASAQRVPAGAVAPTEAIVGRTTGQGTMPGAVSAAAHPDAAAVVPMTIALVDAEETQSVNGPDKVEQIIEALAEQAKVVTPEPRSVVVPERTAPDPEEGLLEEQEQQRAEQPKLFMPNVFTPNNDGINDTYQVVGDGFAKVLVKVFAMKNNQLVFSTHSGEAWTGANCEDGMYLVAVEALTPDGRSVTEGKVVWLNRTPMN